MMGIVVPETCWAYKKYNKIISSIWLVIVLQLRRQKLREKLHSHTSDRNLGLRDGDCIYLNIVGFTSM